MKKSQRNLSLFSTLFTFAVDNLGATIIFPIFAPLFLSSQDHFLPHKMPMEVRTILLGAFLGIYPFIQFFSAPIMGEYSDEKW